MDTEAVTESKRLPEPPRNVEVSSSMLQQIFFARITLLIAWLVGSGIWANTLLEGKSPDWTAIQRIYMEHVEFDVSLLALPALILLSVKSVHNYYEGYAKKAREWPLAEAAVLGVGRKSGKNEPMIAKVEYEAGGRVIAADLAVTGTVDTTVPFLILFEPGGADRPISVKSIPTCVQFPDATPFASICQPTKS